MTDLMVTLQSVGADYRLPSPWWVGLANLAMDYGWTPSPACWSDREEHFCVAVFNRVTDADARSLADALEQALPDVPRHDCLQSHPGRTLWWDGRPVGGPYLSVPPTLHEWFSAENRRMIEEVIALARRGGLPGAGPDRLTLSGVREPALAFRVSAAREGNSGRGGTASESICCGDALAEQGGDRAGE
jgi:hypothetical protein